MAIGMSEMQSVNGSSFFLIDKTIDLFHKKIFTFYFIKIKSCRDICTRI